LSIENKGARSRQPRIQAARARHVPGPAETIQRVTMLRHYALSTYLRQIFGRRVQKIPLDVGAGCPNRDGTLSHGGCVFCNPRGSGAGLLAKGLNLEGQWDHFAAKYRAKFKSPLFMAYLQSFSNTYGPVERLAAILARIAGTGNKPPLPGLAALSIGTRPDCLDQAKLKLLAAQPLDEIWLELGLQSANDATLARINRGHDFACFAGAVRQAASLGLKVCAHVIAGLPGEGKKDFLHTISRVNELPVHGIKFHNLYVAEDSLLAKDWRDGQFSPPALEDYVDWVADGLAILRPDIVIHRLNADPSQDELLAPAWASDKRRTLNLISQNLTERDLWQGKLHIGGFGPGPFDWFSPLSPPPPGLRRTPDKKGPVAGQRRKMHDRPF